MKAAKKTTDTGTESQRISKKHPLDAYQGDCDETQVQGGEDVLSSHHATVEKRKRWRHHQDKTRGNDDPGRISGIDFHLRLPLLRLEGGVSAGLRWHGNVTIDAAPASTPPEWALQDRNCYVYIPVLFPGCFADVNSM
jgi:hypothetical protein